MPTGIRDIVRATQSKPDITRRRSSAQRLIRREVAKVIQHQIAYERCAKGLTELSIDGTAKLTEPH